MQWLRNLVVEVHRRSLWQVLGIYLVGSWVAYQVVIALTQGVGLPDWVPGLAVVLFVIGLPIVLATAFVQEGISQRADRGQDADERAFDPTLFPQEAGHAENRPLHDAAPPRGRLRALLTWRRSMAGGVLAFTLLGVFTTGFLSVRALGIGPAGSLRAAGVLAESDRILVADFEGIGGDTAIARLVTEAFRVDFARSTLVRAVDLSAIREVLRLMDREDLPRLDTELAREVALRDGVHLVVTGEVTTTGAGHLITARLISAETGETVAAFREAARRDDDLIRAVDRLSRTLRARTGESLRVVKRATPLDQVTTSSLEALRKYTESQRAIQFDANVRRGRELLEEAVALDTTFAAAYGALAVLWSNARDPIRSLEALEKARRYEHRLTPEDRTRSRGTYHMLHRQYTAAIAEYEQLLRIKPTSIMAISNTGMAYSQLGNHERAATFYERAARLDSMRYLTRSNYGSSLVKLGRFEEAEREFRLAAELAPFSSLRADIAVLPAAAGDFDAAEARLRALLEDPTTPRAAANRAEGFLDAILVTRGRLAENQQRVAARADQAAADLRFVQERFWDEIQLHERPDRARALLQEMRRLWEGSTDELGRGALLTLTQACALAGELQCAREYLQRAGRAGELPAWAENHALQAQGELALAEGDYTLALRRFRAATDGRGCADCEQQRAGRVFEAMAQPDSAILAYERYLARPSTQRLLNDAGLGSTLLRLAALYEQRGDVQSAARRYAEFIALWERADPELQPRVVEARQRLARLQSDR
jgi:eukaryotic-like serine/threonine-protein kinase